VNQPFDQVIAAPPPTLVISTDDTHRLDADIWADIGS
jgi:hypothetical protein